MLIKAGGLMTSSRGSGEALSLPNNLFRYSNQFGNALWLKTRATVTSNNVVAPDGTTTGDSIVCGTNTDTNTHYIHQAVTAAGNTTYTVSMYVPKSALLAPAIHLFSGFQATAVSARYNPVTGASAVVTAGGGTAAMTDGPNDTWRCSLSATSQASPVAAGIGFMMVDRYTPALSDTTFTGNGALSNPIAWAQLEVGSTAGVYVDRL